MNINDFNYHGITLGAISFLIIGIFHPLVIKGEYYLGKKMVWIFLVMGIIASTTSICVENIFFSTSLGIFGFASFWGIKEVFEQIERVREGRFPKNPNRKYTND